MFEIDLKATLLDDPHDLKREVEYQDGFFLTLIPVPASDLDTELNRHKKKSRRGDTVEVSDAAEEAFWLKRVVGLRGLRDTRSGKSMAVGVRRAQTKEEAEAHSRSVGDWVDDYSDPLLETFAAATGARDTRAAFDVLKSKLWRTMPVAFRGFIREEAQEIESFRGEGDGAADSGVVARDPDAAPGPGAA